MTRNYLQPSTKKEKNDTQRLPLTSRLRRVETLPKTDRPETRKQSVLTPRITVRPLSRKTKSVTVFISTETEFQLERILSEASPFPYPLTLTQLVELMYCEMIRSKAILERAKTEIAHIDMGQKDKKTSMLLLVDLDRFFTKTFQESSYQTPTKLIRWIAKDWSWIYPRLTFKGLNQSEGESV